ncbi:MAG: dihydroorotate dehydrogenase electron transfer subunit [Bacteroidales bacterium]|jgi:dihydroorotate dehydrogenase electron transfer subunit
MAKRIEYLKVSENKRINKDTFLIELLSDVSLPEIKPGQFIQVKIENSSGTFLRRPFSVHDVNYEHKTIKILFQVVGKGTQALSGLAPGDCLNIIYPLGNSFSLPEEGTKCLLIGGGCGIAPLLFLGKYLKSHGTIPYILLGFRNKERIIEVSEYEEIGKVFLSTEDGSSGEKGFITDHSLLRSEKFETVYCCGPEMMMRSVTEYCIKNGIKCEISLENLMGCGIGACLCCVVDTIKGRLCTCTDGPVFNIKELKW